MKHIITGIVVKGDQYGRVLGFPTANLEKASRGQVGTKSLPPGIYAGYTTLSDKKRYASAIVITPPDILEKIETHLISFQGNLYGQKIILELVEFIRPYKKFDTQAELIKNIEKDIQKTKQILAQNSS